MVDVRTRDPRGSAKKPKALFARLKCPNCEREQAIVFRQIREFDESVKDAPLVCLNCCLQVPNRL